MTRKKFLRFFLVGKLHAHSVSLDYREKEVLVELQLVGKVKEYVNRVLTSHS